MKTKYIFIIMLLTIALLITTIILYIKYPNSIEEDTIIITQDTINYINNEKYSKSQEYFIITDIVEYYKTISYTNNTAITYKKEVDIVDNKFTINGIEYTIKNNKICLDECFKENKKDNYIDYKEDKYLLKIKDIKKVINKDLSIIYVYDKYEDLSNIVKDYDITLYTVNIKNIKDKTIKPNTILIYSNGTLLEELSPNELHEYLFNNNYLNR